MLRMLSPRRWSERTMISLVMQHLDNSITTYTKKGAGRTPDDQQAGPRRAQPDVDPVGNEVTRRIAEKIDGVAGGTWGELFNIPLTAHFLGGAAIGDSPEHGVIDPTNGCTAIRPCTSWTGRRSRPTSGQPVAVHHRAGRARRVAVAEQRGEDDVRPGRASRTSGWRRSRRRTRWCRSTLRAVCGTCRSNRSAPPANPGWADNRRPRHCGSRPGGWGGSAAAAGRP